VDLTWGVKPGSINNKVNAEGDPLHLMQDVPFKLLDDFDLAKKETQLLVQSHLDTLFNPNTGESLRSDLVGSMKDNPMEKFKRYCTPGQHSLTKPIPIEERPWCEPSKVDQDTGLPTDENFREGLFRWLANGEGVVRLWHFLLYPTLWYCTVCHRYPWTLDAVLLQNSGQLLTVPLQNSRVFVLSETTRTRSYPAIWQSR
jgi:hypothetical protein